MAFHGKREHVSIRERFGVHAILGVSLGGDKGKSVGSSLGQRSSKENNVTRSTNTGTSKTQLIEAPIRAAANKIVQALVTQQLGKGANSKDINRIAMLLEKRSNNAYREQQDANALALAQAERAGQKEITRLQTNLAADAGGSTKNSFVAGATAEASVDLQVNLAALAGDLEMKARNLQTAELNNALEAFSQSSAAGATDANAIAQLVGTLRGANATSTNAEKATVFEKKNIKDILREHKIGETESQDSLWNTLAKFGD